MAEEEKRRLEKEIQYFKELITSYEHQKLTSSTKVDYNYSNQLSCTTSSKPYQPIASSSRYSLVRNNKPKSERTVVRKVPEAASGMSTHRTIMPPQIYSSTSRTVIPPGNRSVIVSQSKRTVLKPSHSVKSRTVQAPKEHSLRHSLSVTTAYNANTFSNLTKEQSTSNHPTSASSLPSTSGLQKKTITGNDYVSSRENGDKGTRLDTRPPSKFIWVNSKLFPDASKPDVRKPTTSELASVQKYEADGKYTQKSRYKLSKKPILHQPKGNNQPNNSKKRLKAIGKYKLVTSSKKSPISFRHRMSSKVYTSPYQLSYSGKRLVSRYKIRRRSTEKCHVRAKLNTSFGASPRLRKVRKSSSPYKLDHRNERIVRNKYKIDKRKLTRKPSVTRSLAKRSPDRRNLKWVNKELIRSPAAFVSPHRLFFRSNIILSKSPAADKTLSFNKTWVVRKLASRSLQKSAALSLRAKYKKNNTNEKQCLFYMRFGKCKRGDKCFYIHDPDRVAVCTRYLRGTCTIENCLFSHDAKKEKVPVCQHYLRGCCLRDSCPYLHVNVGKDAPVCKNFAEHRYCYLGERCQKLHTDICPKRDEEGKCPLGRKCRLRHPKKLSKQAAKARHTKKHRKLEQDSKSNESQSGAIEDDFVVPQGEKLIEALPAYISLSRTKPSDASDSKTDQRKILKKKPNFL